MGGARSALLIMDVQPEIVARFGDPGLPERLARAATAARAAAVLVIYVKVGFREGHPEIGPRNRQFALVAQTGAFVEDRSSELHPALAPQPGDVVLTKRRVSAFAGSDLCVVLRAGIDALILGSRRRRPRSWRRRRSGGSISRNFCTNANAEGDVRGLRRQAFASRSGRTPGSAGTTRCAATARRASLVLGGALVDRSLAGRLLGPAGAVTNCASSRARALVGSDRNLVSSRSFEHRRQRTIRRRDQSGGADAPSKAPRGFRPRGDRCARPWGR